MCYAVQCQVCGKTTWAGCGEHVDEVKAVVPQDQWCDGHPELDAGAGDLSPAGRR
ncbi:hypothetical protein [Mycobacterium sp. 1423905.2]|uniref:hypothetical protein n=1 Tax=Mycobacterium sp. 1423905.2 TaxID=1856859 RepID=UPI000A780160|nr:hypothetical protein [Mycobacterium sp. 1423905.2]